MSPWLETWTCSDHWRSNAVNGNWVHMVHQVCAHGELCCEVVSVEKEMADGLCDDGDMAERARLIAAAPTLVRALLAVEWSGGTIGRIHHCPACRGADRHCLDYESERIADACPLDAALTAAGLDTAEKRDAARAEIARMAK